MKKPEEISKLIQDAMFLPPNRKEADLALLEVIEQIQIEAYNKAIDNASQKAYDFIEFYQEDKGTMNAIKDSIIKLKK